MRPMPRAFRSVAMILLLWTGGRIIVTSWPEAVSPSSVAAPVKRTVDPAIQLAPVIELAHAPLSLRLAPTEAVEPRPGRSLSSTVDQTSSTATAAFPAQQVYPTPASPKPANVRPPRISYGALLERARADRWSASGWLMYRGAGKGNALAPNGQLAGSQSGARIWRSVASISEGISAGAGVRVSSALRAPAQREIAPGIGVRLGGRFPLEVIAERRFVIDKGGKDRFAILAASGFDDFRLPQQVLLSGYAQAGFVGAKRLDGFVDGSLRAERRFGPALRVGVNAWGAAQPGLSRFDIGPSVALRTDILDQPFRIAVEWRQKVAGNARPGSGPALTLGTDL